MQWNTIEEEKAIANDLKNGKLSQRIRNFRDEHYEILDSVEKKKKKEYAALDRKWVKDHSQNLFTVTFPNWMEIPEHAVAAVKMPNIEKDDNLLNVAFRVDYFNDEYPYSNFENSSNDILLADYFQNGEFDNTPIRIDRYDVYGDIVETYQLVGNAIRFDHNKCKSSEEYLYTDSEFIFLNNIKEGMNEEIIITFEISSVKHEYHFA